MLKRIAYACLAIVLLGGARCNEQRQIPFVQVNFEIDLNLPAYQPLTAPSGWIYVSGGSRGIILYRRSQDEFMAYDRHSTYNVDEACRVTVDEDNILISDPCSESQWVITDGSVVNGPAVQGLQQYNTSWNPPVLRVFN
jgi:nitrite reductase/ring-hydroxylating ferredoxin subunit